MFCPHVLGPAVGLATLFLVGCGGSGPEVGPPVDGSRYLASSEPEGARGVIDVRKDAKDDEEVVVVGKIGGDVNPWVKGRAAFTIVDPSLKACSDIPGDNCPTPWDYCCEVDLPQKTALVKIVDEGGDMVPHGARELLGVKELDTVVVRGKAERDRGGNLTVLAREVYVRK